MEIIPRSSNNILYSFQRIIIYNTTQIKIFINRYLKVCRVKSIKKLHKISTNSQYKFLTMIKSLSNCVYYLSNIISIRKINYNSKLIKFFHEHFVAIYRNILSESLILEQFHYTIALISNNRFTIKKFLSCKLFVNLTKPLNRRIQGKQ